MATLSSVSALVTIEEYLAASYEPDVEFVDGVREEKNLGEWDHGFLQMAIGAWCFNHRAEWKIDVLAEYRTRTSKSRVRLPDVCVVRRGGVVERVGVTPALLVIEILSPEDRPGRVMKRLDDFVSMGVENIWILDPSARSAATYSRFWDEGGEWGSAGDSGYGDLSGCAGDLCLPGLSGPKPFA